MPLQKQWADRLRRRKKPVPPELVNLQHPPAVPAGGFCCPQSPAPLLAGSPFGAGGLLPFPQMDRVGEALAPTGERQRGLQSFAARRRAPWGTWPILEEDLRFGGAPVPQRPSIQGGPAVFPARGRSAVKIGKLYLPKKTLRFFSGVYSL